MTETATRIEVTKSLQVLSAWALIDSEFRLALRADPAAAALTKGIVLTADELEAMGRVDWTDVEKLAAGGGLDRDKVTAWW